MDRRVRLAAAAVTLGGIAIASFAHATITPEASLIVERYLQATGGRSALEAERTLRIKGRLNTLNLKGSFQRWMEAPDHLLEHMTLGTLQIQQGFDGTIGWRVDLTSRNASTLSGKDLERIRGEAYFGCEMWARADQGDGTVAAATSSFRDGEDFCSLDVTPPVGPSRRLWFSVRTGLLTRAVTRLDNTESDSWYTGDRVLAGRTRPSIESAFDPGMHIQWDPHQAADTEQAFTDSVWSNPTINPARFAPPQTAETAVAWEKTRGVAELPFRYGSSHVWVRGSINGGPPGDFIIDTGATMTVLDREYAEEIGLGHEGTAGVQGMGGAGEVSFSRLQSFRLGGTGEGVILRDLKVGLTDLASAGEPYVWRRMCGLIGYDILRRFVVEIDYDRSVVTFRDPNQFAYQGKGQPLDMALTQGVPVVHARLDNGCEGDFLVDVGNAFGVVLHGSVVRRCRLLDDIRGHKQLEMVGGGVGATFVSWVTRVDRIGLGPFEVLSPVVGVTLGTHGMVGSQDFAGNIGSDLLKQFICTFDYAHGRLYLEPGKSYGLPGHFSRCGTIFARYKHRIVAEGVLRGSAAEDAGLKPADEITRIDEEPAMSFTAEDMDRMFTDGEPGSTHTLTITRDGKSKTLTLTLKDAL